MNVTYNIKQLNLAIFEECYLELDDLVKTSLRLFLEYLDLAQNKHNFTALKGSRLIFEKFVLESIILEILDVDLKDKQLLDLGSGAGIPGIIIQIVRSNCLVTTLDKSPVKIKFQSEVKQKLKLRNLTPVCANSKVVEFKNNFDYILVRAYKNCSFILYQALKFTKVGAKIVVWKGEKWRKEWQETDLSLQKQYLLEAVYRYNISTKTGGFLIIFKRV